MGMHPCRRPLTPETIAAAQATVASLSAAVDAARSEAGAGALVLAWVSDLHLHAARAYDELSPVYAERINTAANVQLALTEIAALQPQPDLLVFGGDLADSGCAGEAPADEYAELGRLLDAHLPPTLSSLAIPGNHDHADRPLTPAWHAALAAASRPDWPRPVAEADYFFETRLAPWRLLGLDSRQGQPLSEEQRQWLAEQLQAADETPTAILVHRPLVSVGNWVDDFRLVDRTVFDLIDACPAVKLLCSGHTHRAACWEFRGKSHLVFPACAYGIPDPVGWGVVVLGPDRPVAMFVKDLGIDCYYDCVSDGMRPGSGAWRRLVPRDFARDMLFNPCLLPRG